MGFNINHDIKQGSKIYPHVHWSTDGTDTVFGLFVDLHVEIERAGTLNKAPDFYA